jgi:hypothetical protein
LGQCAEDLLRSQPGGRHALNGQEGVGLELDRLAEEHEVEGERVAGPEVADLGRRLEDVGARARGQAAEERRRLLSVADEPTPRKETRT